MRQRKIFTERKGSKNTRLKEETYFVPLAWTSSTSTVVSHPSIETHPSPLSLMIATETFFKKENSHVIGGGGGEG